MKIHRFIGDFNLEGKEIVITDKALVHQMARVLRLKMGESVVFGDGKGKETSGKIKKISSNEVVVSIQKISKPKEMTESKISLYVAMLKKENFEWVAQKATEIGVSELIPIWTDRVVKQTINERRVKKIMNEAAEQSGRKILPELTPILTFSEAIKRSRQSNERWLMDMSGSSTDFSGQAKSISIFIGPEGGWTDEEKKEAKKSGLRIISVGNLTLRAETAAIISAYLGVCGTSKKGLK